MEKLCLWVSLAWGLSEGGMVSLGFFSLGVKLHRNCVPGFL